MKGEQLNVNKSTKKIKTNAKHKKMEPKIMANGTSFQENFRKPLRNGM